MKGIATIGGIGEKGVRLIAAVTKISDQPHGGIIAAGRNPEELRITADVIDQFSGQMDGLSADKACNKNEDAKEVKFFHGCLLSAIKEALVVLAPHSITNLPFAQS
jgi:hypothetical protein